MFPVRGQKVMSFSGMQLVTGTTIMEPQMFGTTQERKIKGETLAILAFLDAITGLGLSFVKGKAKTTLSAVAGGIGIILLLLLKSKLDNYFLRETGGILQLDYRVGFYLTLILFISALGVNVYSMAHDKGLPLLKEKGGTIHKFYTECGARLNPDPAFCSECGAKSL
jgi:hypothetical protein